MIGLTSEQLTDAAKFSAGLVALLTITLGWVHLSGQKRISREIRSAIAIAIRLTYVYVVFVVIFYWLVGLNPNIVLTILFVIYVFAVLVEEFDVGHDVLTITFALFVLFPLWVVKQFILGFPDRHLLVPPSYAYRGAIAKRPAAPRINELPTESLTVVAMLRPMGKVAWGDAQYEACSSDGQMIEVGSKVTAVGRRDGMFVVRRVDAKS